MTISVRGFAGSGTNGADASGKVRTAATRLSVGATRSTSQGTYRSTAALLYSAASGSSMPRLTAMAFARVPRGC